MGTPGYCAAEASHVSSGESLAGKESGSRPEGARGVSPKSTSTSACTKGVVRTERRNDKEGGSYGAVVTWGRSEGELVACDEVSARAAGNRKRGARTGGGGRRCRSLLLLALASPAAWPGSHCSTTAACRERALV